jgi:polysaccharide pyruvyl transferase WcaK-like protein
VRIHLGHHFYGAGNLGDDFMLAGFLTAMRPLAPHADYTCCVPFALEPLQRRFPGVRWLPYDETTRTTAIATCDVWLGVGGSPFQSAQSRWFVDHLLGEAARCESAGKPMYFLGIGAHSTAELRDPVVVRICAQVAGIWTRDPASATRLRELPLTVPVESAADLAHLYFRVVPPPPAEPGRVAVVANFDFGPWPGQTACLAALAQLPARDRIWLAQETRDLPGAERTLFAALPPGEQARWRLASPEIPGAPLSTVLAQWPAAEWLVTSRFHAAIAGAWSGSKVVVISTNEKLRAAAAFGGTAIPPDADSATALHALQTATVSPRPIAAAEAASAACAAFVRQASRGTGKP